MGRISITPRQEQGQFRTGRCLEDLVESCPKTRSSVMESFSLRIDRTLKFDPGRVASCVTYLTSSCLAGGVGGLNCCELGTVMSPDASRPTLARAGVLF